jgi:hypothetical protein
MARIDRPVRIVAVSMVTEFDGSARRQVLPGEDVTAIQALVHRDADAVVRRGASDWGACWAPGASWDLGHGRSVEGRAATAGPAGGRWHVDERFSRADATGGTLLAPDGDECVQPAYGRLFASRVLDVHEIVPPDLAGEFPDTDDGLRPRGPTAEV